MQGNLKDMAVADLIQHLCQARRTAQLTLKQQNEEAVLFFKDGSLPHAVLGQLQGEEAVFKALGWEDGVFKLDANVETPATTITRNWAALLVEGARLLDEAHPTASSPLNTTNNSVSHTKPEENQMPKKLDDVLKEMVEQIDGGMAAVVAGMDGLPIAQYVTVKKGVDPARNVPQMTMLLKLIDSTITKLGAGQIENELLVTERAYMMVRFLEGNRAYFMGIVANRSAAKLGNIRLITKIYAKHIAEAMPR